MSCTSTRRVLFDNDDGDPPETITCIRGTGHTPRTRHRAILSDGTTIEWDGAPAPDAVHST